MKSFTFKDTWKEIVPFTEEEKIILKGDSKEAKKAIIDGRYRDVDPAVAQSLQVIYDANKPILKDGDVYQLIGADINEDGNGIINCRVNGEHQQIRM